MPSASSHKIVPHLWFDQEAVEAAEFYSGVFPESRVTHAGTITGTPSGDCDVVSFEVWGQPFMAISAGPLFKPNPSISFFVNVDPSREHDAAAKLDAMWAKLTQKGTVLMPLDAYPFSRRYGWVQDQYGVSWQLILTDPSGDPRPPIVPSLMFVGEVAGKAEEAMQFYLSVFKNTKPGQLARYPADMEPDREGTVMFCDFMLENQWFAAMDSAHSHAFGFTEGVSLMVKCDSQEEIDHYWERLSAVPEAEQCGWLKDRFGASWQIVPTRMDEMMQTTDKEQLARVTQAFLKMKKFDLAKLEAGYQGE